MSRRHTLLVMMIVVMWGFNSIAIKLGLSELPPLLMTMLRFTVISVLIIPFTRISRTQIMTLLPLSFTLGFMHFSLMFIGTGLSDAGTSAVIVQLGTPLSVLIATLFFSEKLSKIQVGGMFASFFGVILISGSPVINSWSTLVILLLSAIGWALSNTIIKHRPPIPPLTMTGWIAFLAIPQVGLLSAVFEHNQYASIVLSSWKGWFGVMYSALVASIIAYTLWYKLLNTYPVNILMPWSLLTPAFAVILGWVVLSEQMNAHKILGATVILLGTLISSLRRTKKHSSKLAMNNGK